jgi:catechol 2,3-dioxygenase-like lactoylglutathione lyase family enzyme
VIAPQGLNLKQRDLDVSGYNHWALGIADKERFCQELKKKGVAVLELEREDRKIFFVKDPEGNLIEIYESS